MVIRSLKDEIKLRWPMKFHTKDFEEFTFASILIGDLGPLKQDAERADIPFPKKNLRLWAVKNPEGQIVAFCGAVLYAEKAKFTAMYVIPAYRGRGLFRVCLDLRLQMMRDIGIKKVEATCTKYSIKEYLARGAKVVKEYKKFWAIELPVTPQVNK